MKYLVVFISFLALLYAPPLFAASFPSKLHSRTVLSSQETTVEVGSKKGLVVVFLSAVCPCSNSHLGELAHLSNEYPDFAFVGVHSNMDENKEQTVAYFKKAKLPFPVLQDTGAKIADQFKALKTPHAFIILKNGTAAYQGGVSSSTHFESADRKYLREALADLQAGRKIKTPVSRTLGCIISRGEKYVW